MRSKRRSPAEASEETCSEVGQRAGMSPEEQRRRIRLVPGVAVALLALAFVAGGTASSVSGYGPRLSDSGATKPRLTLRIKGQGVVFVGAVRLRCVSQAVSNVVCKDTVAFGRTRTVTVQERPRSGWRFVRWSGSRRGASGACQFHIVHLATLTATFRRS
jgi:hypothetical protein